MAVSSNLGRCLFAGLCSLFAILQLTAASPHAQPNNGASGIAKRAVPYGELIYGCDVKGVIAPAFDDGPWIYTEDILNRMEAANFKATWFINGQNKDNIYKYNATLKRMIALGHQIGSHTWSHKDLTTLSAADVRLQMTQLEDALINILGYMPTYMRPPFLAYNQQVLDILSDLQYVVIYGDINTRDWAYQSETEIKKADQLFIDGLDNGGSIVESHDETEWTHGVLIDFMIQTVKDRNIKTVPVGECMGQSPSEWYRTARGPKPSQTNTATAPTSTSIISPNGLCGLINAGANLGYTCPRGRCCSKWGNCGTTSDYCGFGNCQQAYSGTTCDGAPPAGSTTPDGTCGNVQNGQNRGYVCGAGLCCSKYGWCGTGDTYCVGCQSAFSAPGVCAA